MDDPVKWLEDKARELDLIDSPDDENIGIVSTTYLRDIASGLRQTATLIASGEDRKTDGESRFKVGDLVRHRASGRRGVVTHVNRRCTTHPTSIANLLPVHGPDECIYEFSGVYTLSLDLGDLAENCSEVLLEPAGNGEEAD